MKRFLSLVVILCILLCTLAVAANEPPHSTITWEITGGTLTVKGTGAMDDYKTESQIPWHDKSDEITKIVVKEGITKIGNLAFYGLSNAKEAKIADSVEAVGLHAFSYTEGARADVSELGSGYQFRIESDSSVVNAGSEFTLTISLSADFKDISTVQTALIYDQSAISIDESSWYDTEWYESVNKDNLGYISSPMYGFVANNLRIGYVSTSGAKIDEGSPLYTMGKTDLVIAKVKCKALVDIEDVNTSLFMIKNSGVAVSTDKTITPVCGETQLTSVTRLPMKNLVIDTGSLAVKAYAELNSITVKGSDKSDTGVKVPPVQTPVTQKPDGITVLLDGKEIEFDVEPFLFEDRRTMVPLRAIFEAMGATVMWDNDTFTAFAARGDDFVAIQIGKDTLFKNNVSVSLDAPAMLKDSRTLVPLRAVSEAFGHDVQWDNDTQTVTITTK